MNEIQNAVFRILENQVKEADNLLFEYMKKKGLSFSDLDENVAIQNLPFGVEENDGAVLRYWYKDELILSMKQRIYQTGALEVKAEMVIEKGDW